MAEISKDCDYVLHSVVTSLLQEVKTEYEKDGKLSDNILTALSFIFQSILVPALELIDDKKICLVTSPSGRQLFQVLGSSGVPYVCYASSYYCSCPAYKFSVLKKNDHIMCKHVLAARLSYAMGNYRTTTLSDQEVTNMIIGND